MIGSRSEHGRSGRWINRRDTGLGTADVLTGAEIEAGRNWMHISGIGIEKVGRHK
jgi:hypothetical protein